MLIKKILREAKKIVYDPLNYFPDLITDIKKDFTIQNFREKHNFIWCCERKSIDIRFFVNV